jgi:hypothetical protein
LNSSGYTCECKDSVLQGHSNKIAQQGASSVGGTPPQKAGVSRKLGQTMQQVEGKAVQMLDTQQDSCSRNKMQLIWCDANVHHVTLGNMVSVNEEDAEWNIWY